LFEMSREKAKMVSELTSLDRVSEEWGDARRYRARRGQAQSQPIAVVPHQANKFVYHSANTKAGARLQKRGGLLVHGDDVEGDGARTSVHFIAVLCSTLSET
jgi:hypothetical protein